MEEYDELSQASLNGIYVKAKELDRGHNSKEAPPAIPAGLVSAETAFKPECDHDVETHASTHASDASTNISDAESHASTHASDVQSNASDAHG